MAYFVCFAVSILFAYLANKAKKKSLFLLFSVISVLIPVMLAGMRDYSIGVDVKNYLKMDRFWAGAQKAESLVEYLKYYLSLGLREPLFALYIGAIEKITGEYRVFLILSHTIIMTGVYIGAYRMRKHARPEMVLILFFLLYYNYSLNTVRQYIAMAVVFAFFADLERRKFLRYAIVVAVMSLVHTTTLLAFVPLVLYIILYPKRGIYEVPLKKKIILSALIIVGVVVFIPMVRLMMRIGVLGTKYTFYLKDEFERMSFTRMGLIVLEIAGFVYCYKKLQEHIECADFYLINTVVFVCFQQLAMMIVYGQRVTAYFSFANIVTLSMFPKCQTDKKKRYILYATITALCLYYWYYMYVKNLSSQTIPYVLGV